MIKESLPRSTKGFLVTMTLVTGMTTALTAGFAEAAAAAPHAIEGTACSYDEVGRQVFTIESTWITPVVTHFTSFYVTTGTLSENTYRLSLVDRVNTTINGRNDSSQTLFDEVTRTVGFAVRKDQGTTDTQDTTVRWRFNSPGYYGLYKGTKRVSGDFSVSVCSPAWGSPRYVSQGRGTYSTFGPIEEGTVQCNDPLPNNTVRKTAQSLIGCKGVPKTPAKKAAK